MFVVANAEKNTLAKKERKNKYEMGDYEVDMKNKNNSHTLLIDHAIGAKKVLDVGCGVGYIGRAIKKIQKCTVDGIDIDEDALKVAKKYYNQTKLMRLGDNSDKAFLSFLKDPKTYDCIICGDIIEHLVDPGYIVAILSKKLTTNGKLLISIPNIAHIDIIAHLIDGEFNYFEFGILDNTHLRFWTESSFYDFVKNVNNHYDVSLGAKRIAKVVVKHPVIDTRQFEGICGNEIYTFQNIFELKNEKKPTFPHVHKKNNYHNIIATIDKGEIENLKNQLNEKNKILSGIENSLSWKITKPLRKINALLHKHQP